MIELRRNYNLSSRSCWIKNLSLREKNINFSLTLFILIALHLLQCSLLEWVGFYPSLPSKSEPKPTSGMEITKGDIIPWFYKPVQSKNHFCLNTIPGPCVRYHILGLVGLNEGYPFDSRCCMSLQFAWISNGLLPNDLKYFFCWCFCKVNSSF